MIYRTIGVMSGSSLDGLDIAFVEFQENGGKWLYEIKNGDTYSYSIDWMEKLRKATSLGALDYQLLHTEYGHFIGAQINDFIEKHSLQFQVSLVASHGHTSFHVPAKRMTAQLGDGAAIASETRLPVVTDLRALDVAFGGQGAPIVPIGEKILLGDYRLFLNLGGIANISFNADRYVAFDVCPANRVLNSLANSVGMLYDDRGAIASSGNVREDLLEKLNALDYYGQLFPKSLANDLGTDIIFPMLSESGYALPDLFRTYIEHIVFQVKNSIQQVVPPREPGDPVKMLVTGGGALNDFLMRRLGEEMQLLAIEVDVPESILLNYKEAMIMAFMGVLRWRQEYNVLATVTGASRNTINGALWIGEEA